MKKYDISIIGTVGIPSNYGGFETLVEFTVPYLIKNHTIQVICSGPSYKKRKYRVYKGATLKYLPIKANGLQSIVYDIISIIISCLNSRTILLLGVSGAIILPIIRLFSKTNLVVNIDGLEWRRPKWGKLTRSFLKFSEKLAIKYADKIVVDNQELQDYVRKKYGINSTLIAYGGDHIYLEKQDNNFSSLEGVNTKQFLGIGRIEPENNIHLILEAFSISNKCLTYIGNWENSNYGRKLFHQYSRFKNIQLVNPVYDQKTLNRFRSQADFYIHGHSAGGSNPSLIEAIFYKIPILAFDCSFNRYTTFNKSTYWKTPQDLWQLISDCESIEYNADLLKLGNENYKWSVISDKYSNLFKIKSS